MRFGIPNLPLFISRSVYAISFVIAVLKESTLSKFVPYPGKILFFSLSSSELTDLPPLKAHVFIDATWLYYSLVVGRARIVEEATLW